MAPATFVCMTRHTRRSRGALAYQDPLVCMTRHTPAGRRAGARHAHESPGGGSGADPPAHPPLDGGRWRVMHTNRRAAGGGADAPAHPPLDGGRCRVMHTNRRAAGGRPVATPHRATSAIRAALHPGLAGVLAL
jgi:hypothetical protein